MNKIYFFKYIVCFLLLLQISLCNSVKLSAQQANNVLLTNVDVSGQLLELDIAANMAGTYFAVGAVKNNQYYSNSFLAREGKHFYDLRSIPEWDGVAEYVITTLPKGTVKSSRLSPPSLASSWDIFMTLDPFSPRTVNFSQPRPLFGIKFSYLLLLIGVVGSLLVFFVFKRSLITALLVGGLLSFVCMDARYMVDRWGVVQAAEKNYPYTPPLTIPQRFVEKATPIMGDGTWAFQGKFSDDYFKLFFQYSFADIPYHLNWREAVNDAPSGTFIITEKPTGGQNVLVQEGNFYLVVQP